MSKNTMRIRLSELKRIIRSEVRRTLHEDLSAGMVGTAPEPTAAEKAAAENAVQELINDASDEQLLAVLTAAAEGNEKLDHGNLEAAIAALEDAGVTPAMQVSHRHRRGSRLYEVDALTIGMSANAATEFVDNPLTKTEANAILYALGLTGMAAATILTFFSAPLIVTLGTGGVGLALAAAATKALLSEPAA